MDMAVDLGGRLLQGKMIGVMYILGGSRRKGVTHCDQEAGVQVTGEAR